MRETRTRWAVIKLTVFALVSLLVGMLLYSTLSNSIQGATSSYTAMFDDASGLHAGDNVRVAGVRVGRVDAVHLVGTEAEVRITVEAAQPILASTTLAIRYQNLIGQRYVAMLPGVGSSAVVPPGSRIPKGSTKTALDLTLVLNGFQPLFQVLSPADINRLSTSLVQVLQGEGGSIFGLLRETSQLSTHLADRDQVIGRVVTNFASVLQHIGDRDAEVDALIGQLRGLATAAAADREQIGGSLQALADLTDSTTALLRDIRPQLHDDLGKLERVTAEYARQRIPFTKAVEGLPDTLRGFARTMQYGSWVNLYTCNLVISRPGGKTQKVADSGANSEVCA
jgi:phospholipid/cholesterol/gamma-HCH transport system substrate-binding protein